MEGFIARIKTYIKSNWLFLIVMAVGSLAILVQMREVVLYADDYSLGFYSSGGVGAAFDYLANHYMTWGGGYTSFLVIILFGLGKFVWQLTLALLLITFIGLSVKMLCKNHQKFKWLIATVLWSLTFILSIWVSREVIYWLDGGMAYLFSMFQVFIIFYFMYTRLVQKTHKKYDFILIPLLAFFAGWSSAQSGVIAIVMMLAMLAWQQFIKKERVTKLYIISTVLCVVGFLIFYFAPGNSARMDTFTEYTSYGLFERIAYRIGSVTSLIFNTEHAEFTAAPFFVYLAIGLVALVDLKTIKQEKSRPVKILRLACSVYSLLFLFAFMLSFMNIPELSPALRFAFKYINFLSAGEKSAYWYLGIFPYFFAFLAIAASLINAFFISKRNQNPFLIVAFIMAYLAEFSMLMAPYSPLRTTFYTTAFMWISIAYLIVVAKKEEVDTLPVFLAVFTILNLYLGITLLILATVLYFVIPNRAKLSPTTQIYLCFGLLFLLAGTNYVKTLVNYHRNRIINEENISRIEALQSSYQSTGESPEVLYLIKPYNETYGFTGLAGIDWVERAIIMYYQLPETLDLKYEGEA